MDDITKEMVAGRLCASCYKFMGDSCGYPRKCKDCTDKGLTYKILFKDIYDYAFKNIRKIVKESNDNIYDISDYILWDYSKDGKYGKSISPVMARKVEDKLYRNNVIYVIWN